MTKQDILKLINQWEKKQHAVAFYYPKKGFIRINGHTCYETSIAIAKMQADLKDG